MIDARHLILAAIVSLVGVGGKAHAQWSNSGTKVFYTGGNVGVGTSNPAYKLDVRSSGMRAINISATAASGNTFGVYARNQSTSGRGVFGYASANSGTNYGVFGQTNSPDGFAGYFLGGRNYFEGNVGIGSTDPVLARLDVTTAGLANLALRGPGGGVVRFIDTNAGLGWDLSSDATGFAFSRSGVDSPLVIRADTGAVSINNAGAVTNGFMLEVGGNIRCDSITENSAREFKQEIVPLAGALDSIMKLRGVSYAWNDKAPASVQGKHDIGFIADEVNAVFPDIVAKDENGKPVGINYGRITPVAVEAIKQLKAENDELKARLEKLEALVAAQAAKNAK